MPLMASLDTDAAFTIWPDTGQRICYDDSGNVLDPCPAEGEPFYGQDAQYQNLPRSYTKLGLNGDSWSMVLDNITGLTWEVKEAKDNKTDFANPHDADNLYTWCDTTPELAGGNNLLYCGDHDTEDFIGALNNANFGGYADWRVPTLKELQTLITADTTYRKSDDSYVTINQLYFPNTSIRNSWWSSAAWRDLNSFYPEPWFRRMVVNFSVGWSSQVSPGEYGLPQHQLPNTCTLTTGDFYKVHAFWEMAQIEGLVGVKLVR